MEWEQAIEYRIRALLPQITGEQPQDVRIRRSAVRGGLEAGAVGRFAVRYRGADGRERALNIIGKQLDGRGLREAGIYQSVLTGAGAGYAPALFGVDEDRPDRRTLLLEDVARRSAWPWRETSASQAVLESLARLHDSRLRESAVDAPHWDYGDELRESACATLHVLEQMRSHPSFGPVARRGLRAVRRLALNVDSIRAELLDASAFERCFIHGDVHPGNVLLRRRARGNAPVFLDWARARAGSPLEDVSSWLQSLGLWEPEARRRHDTLLRGYLGARGRDARLDQALRDAYAVAGACNALAGALRYYCVQVEAARSAPARAHAAHLAGQWLRVLQRADAAAN